MRLHSAVILTFASLLSSAELQAGDSGVSFYRDVMPILSKGNCNSGACHGNANGKGGLKLSLRGESPALDLATLTKDVRSKRVNIDHPDDSYLLRKPAKLVSHEGGEKFTATSPEFAILHQWLAEGARGDVDKAAKLTQLKVEPTDEFLDAPHWQRKITATATFADGSQRDVSRWAVYEPSNLLVEITPDGLVSAKSAGETTIIVRFLHLQQPVRLAFVADRPDFQWDAPPPFNALDEPVLAKLKRLKINPSPVCDDGVFLRRAYFDLLGIPPTAEAARSFLADSASTKEKRSRLVDSLLVRTEFGEHWALKWSDLLRNEEKVIDRRGVEIFWEWLRDWFNADKPLDEMARRLVTGLGSTYLEPPANYYRALRDPATRAEATAQVFLGTRLQCAKCHNHPFEKWTQEDYYRFASLFDGMEYHVLSNTRIDKFDKHEFAGEQVVFLENKREFKDPRTGKPAAMGFLDPAAGQVPENPDRFDALARWLTSSQNPLFAKVQANRIWHQLNGQGVVDPVDDFRATNPPSNPALLEALTHEFVAGGYRVKPLVRSILLSRTYQLASELNSTNREDTINFSHARIRRLTAEQLLDAVHLALNVPAKFRAVPDVSRAGQMCGVKVSFRGQEPMEDDRFLKCFGKPSRLISSEIERSNETSMAQVFTLTSGRGVDEMLRTTQNRLGEILANYPADSQGAVEATFWHFLSRGPSEPERQYFTALLEKASDRRAALEDLAWSLLNAKEFWLRW